MRLEDDRKEKCPLKKRADKSADAPQGTAPANVANNEAVNGIYEQYDARLRQFLEGKLDNPEDREDVAQEVYLRLIRDPRLHEREITFAFICTIASNIIKDRFRRQQVRKMNAHVSLTDMKLKSPELTPEEWVQSEQSMDMFRNVYKSLDKAYQRAFTLHRFVGLTYSEIASEMGISKRTVCKYISESILKFREQFGETS
ncbi:MAG: RNA polymerase sigma factor [Deltaproteobacteria bacterium]|nr:RNA polymerase sigma factor [Deltaproteobacteria bacterium]